MSITGSLVGYENNNEITITKKTHTSSSSVLTSGNRSLLNITTTSGGSISKPCPSLNSSISNSIITTACSNLGSTHHQHQQNAKNQNMSNRKSLQKQQHHHHQQQQKSYHQKHLEGQLRSGGVGQHMDGNGAVSHLHLNSLWSIWYGILVTLFQGYLAVHGAYRFLGCSLVQWKIEPIVELNIQIVICGVVFILLPLFFASAVFKVGNLANDGIKLGTMTQSRCSISPHDGLEEEAKGGTVRALWTHGGPTAAFIHIVIAMCLLLPRLLLEARIIENGLLPRENIWRNELDFIGSNRERLVVMSFTTSPYQNRTIGVNDTNYYWDDDNSLTNVTQKSVAHVYKLYPKLPVFESEAVEQFFPDNSEFMESHENLEMEVTSISSAAPMKMMKNFKSTIGATKQTTPSTTTRTTKSIRNEVRKSGSKNLRKHSHKSNKSGEERRSHFKLEDVNRSLEVKTERFDFNNFKDEELSTVFESSSHSKTGRTTPTIRKIHSSPVSRETVASRSTSTVPTILRHHTTQITTTKASGLPDSDIHIVKPERLPEIIPSTPIASNSKIFEIKTKKVKKRTILEESADEDAVIVEILPEALIGAVPANMSSYSLNKLDGFSGMLQRFFGIEKPIDVTSFSHPPSMEFLNFVLALMVWSIRYPAVFWSTTKSFATIFSIQMVANTIDVVFSYVGVSTLYKLQMVGQVLPSHTPGLLLNAVVTLALFILSTILVIASSLIFYLYGHGRLAARMRDRCMITVKNSESWIYFAHCASLCLVLALAVVKAPLMHDLSATYRGSLDNSVFCSALASVVHLFVWIVIWLGLTAKRRWSFKLPPLVQYGTATSGAAQPLLISTRDGHGDSKGLSTTSSTDGVEDTIYWPKLTPNSPKLKVTFNEVTSTSEDVIIIGEHDGKRSSTGGTTICITSVTGEADDGDYATLRGGAIQGNCSLNGGGIGIGCGGGGIGGGVGPSGTMLHLSEYDELPPPPEQLLLPPSCNTVNGMDFVDDNTSEEGKLLACVRDDSVTYASTRDLEPPHPPPPPAIQSPLVSSQQHIEVMHLGSPVDLVSPLAPVTVTVHTNEAHIASSSTPRCLRRADSGVPNEALTPRSDTTSTTESTTSPPERAPSESSSGVHSGEEREEVVIRPRVVSKAVPKPPPPVIQEEPFSRSTNMKMSSFNNDSKSSATLPLTRNAPEPRIDYSHCSTMPLPMGCHQAQYKPKIYTPTASTKQLMHTTLPNGVRYSNPHILRRIPHVTKAESPYGHLGLGAGHHTFSKLLQDPIHSLAATTIPEDRDSANFSMSSETERECLYANAQPIN